MKQSETISKLSEALAKAQGEMENAAKDKANPFFKSNYADLASVWDACRGPLSKNGLSIVQGVDILDDGKITLTTKLLHMSGEELSSEMIVRPAKNDPQGIGSAITYYRRFSLSAMVGIAPAEKPTEDDVADDDDDGNAASGKIIVTPRGNENDRALHSMLINDITILINQRSIPLDDIKSHIKNRFDVESSRLLTVAQLKEVIEWIRATFAE